MSRLRTLDKPGSRQGVAPEFIVPPDTLDVVGPSGGRGGVFMGTDSENQPVSASIMQPVPARMVTVGGLYLARQIAMRAMATGAVVIVATGRPAAWKVLEQATGGSEDGRPPALQIRRLAHSDLPRSTEEVPVLVVHDGGAVPQELFRPRAPWQTTMYLLPYLHPQVSHGPVARASDLVMIQRLPLNQAQLAGRMWNLNPQQVQGLTQLEDDKVISLGDRTWHLITLTTGQRERDLLGPIRRGD